MAAGMAFWRKSPRGEFRNFRSLWQKAPPLLLVLEPPCFAWEPAALLKKAPGRYFDVGIAHALVWVPTQCDLLEFILARQGKWDRGLCANSPPKNADCRTALAQVGTFTALGAFETNMRSMRNKHAFVSHAIAFEGDAGFISSLCALGVAECHRKWPICYAFNRVECT